METLARVGSARLGSARVTCGFRKLLRANPAALHVVHDIQHIHTYTLVDVAVGGRRGNPRNGGGYISLSLERAPPRANWRADAEERARKNRRRRARENRRARPRERRRKRRSRVHALARLIYGKAREEVDVRPEESCRDSRAYLRGTISNQLN